MWAGGFERSMSGMWEDRLWTVCVCVMSHFNTNKRAEKRSGPMLGQPKIKYWKSSGIEQKK